MIAVLLLGSNRGDKVSLIEKASGMVQELSKGESKLSSLYESEPWGFDTDEWFLNRAVIIDTNLDPYELLNKILFIEKELGRVREISIPAEKVYSSREIDIDIIFYSNLLIDSKSLIVPHPRMHLRRFVLEPVCEIAPDYVHPGLRVTVRQFLTECEDTSKVIKKG